MIRAGPNMVRAVKANNMLLVEEYLSNGVDPNSRDSVSVCSYINYLLIFSTIRSLPCPLTKSVHVMLILTHLLFK